MLADDASAVRDVLADILRRSPDIDLVATVRDEPTLLAVIAETRPDVVVTDLRMPPTWTDEGVRVRVVSMPCWELFEAQAAEYRERVLPHAVRARVAVEPGVPLGWKQWVGDAGEVLGIDRFGASAPGTEVLERLGFTVEGVLERARAVLERVG